nr:acyltransferase [Rhizobium sp. CSW-27]
MGVKKFQGEIKPLTSLRFFAAMAVVFFHFGASAAERVGLPGFIVSMLKNGYLGVSFFFVLSGFILVVAYDGRLGAREQRYDFFISRLARIYPVYILALALSIPFTDPVWPESVIFAPLLLQSWTLPASNLGGALNMPSWTLSIELFFYVFFAIFFVKISRLPTIVIGTLAACMAGVIIFADVAVVHPGIQLDGWIRFIPLPVFRLPEFLLGVLSALLVSRLSIAGELKGMDRLFFCVLALVAVILAEGSLASRLMPVACAVLIVAAALSTGPVLRIFSNPFLVFLGGASYAAYLLQMSVNGVFDVLFGDNFASRIAMPVVLVALSCCVYKWVEEPARRYIKGLKFSRFPREA